MFRFSGRIENRIKQVGKQFQQRSRENLLRATMEWHAAIVEDQLVGPRHGRRYRIPGARRYYTASAPGEPPAQRLGHLRNSYRFRLVGANGEEVGEVGSPLWHALYTEKGTRRMKPRPHVMRAYLGRRDRILAHLGKRWDGQ